MSETLLRRPRIESVPFVTPLGENPQTYVPLEHVGRVWPNMYCRSWIPSEGKYCENTAGKGTVHPGTGRCVHHGGRAEATRRYHRLENPRIADLIEYFENDPDPMNVFSELAMLRALATDFVDRYDDITEALLGWWASFRVTKRPIPAGLQASFESLVSEYEVMLAERDLLDDTKTIQVEEAKKFVHLLKQGPEVERPRKVMDITDAVQIIDSTGKMVERIMAMREKNAVSEAELNRILNMMGRVVDVVIPNGEIPTVDEHGDPMTGAKLKAKVREGWLDVVTR